MPRVPTYEREQLLRPANRQGIDVRASPEAFGAGVGRAVQNVAAGLGDMADTARAWEEKEAATVAKEGDNAYAAWERNFLWNPETGYFNKQGRDAVYSRADVEKTLQEKRKEFGANLQGLAGEMYKRASGARLDSALGGVIRHAGKARKQWVTDTSRSRIETFSTDAVSDFRNPRAVQRNVLAAKAELRALASDQGWSEDTYKAEADKLETGIRSAVFDNYQAVFNTRIDGLQTEVFNDPTGFENAARTFAAEVDASPIPDPMKQAVKDAGREALSLGVSSRMLQDDPATLMGSLGVAVASPDIGYGNPSLPAGMRNNNPGNIKFVGQGRRRGVVGPSENTDQGDPQAVFESPEAGMREAYRLALSKYQNGKTTANELIAGQGGWTPGNTQAAANIAETMGLGPDDDLNLGDPNGAALFLRALVRQEHGEASEAYSDQMIAAAVTGDGAAPSSPVARRGADLPLIGKGGGDADLEGVQSTVVDRFRQLQNQWGQPLPINSGYRDPKRNARAGGAKGSQHIHGNALDIDVSALSKEERLQLIEMASALGFTGIGVYQTAIHLDAGNRRAWGGSYGRESVPDWAEETVQAHLAGRLGKGGPIANAAGGPAALQAPGRGLDPRLAGLPFAKRLEMAAHAQKAASDRLAEANAQRKAEYEAYNDALELRVLTGQVSSEMEILNDDVLSDSDKASRLRTYRSQQKEATETDQAVQDYIAGGNPNWNPLDGDDAKQANDVFDRLSKQVETPEQQQAITDEFLERTGVIPSSVAADLRRDGFSQDPDALANAMGTAARIEQIAPESFQTMPSGGDLRKDLASFQHLVRNRGFSAEDAARRLIERRSPEYRVNEEILGPLADKAVKDLDVTEVTDAFDEGLFASEPGSGADVSTQNALLAEYREAFREEFIRVGGDEGDAKARAAKELSRTWGVSKVSGDKQLMKFPPEKFYPPISDGHAYLSEDMTSTAAEFAGAEIGRAVLRPDAATSADVRAGRPPRYRLFYEREIDGQTIIDQVPGYWAMPPERVQELAQTARANDTAMRRAEALRQTYEAAVEGGGTAEGVNAVMPTLDLITGQFQRLQKLNPFGGAQAGQGTVAGGKQPRLNRQSKEPMLNAPR